MMMKVVCSFGILLLFFSRKGDAQQVDDDIQRIFNSSFWEQYEVVTQPPLGDISALAKCGEGDQQGRFVCVPYYNCDPRTKMVTQIAEEDYRLNLDVRAGTDRDCVHFLDTCCEIPPGGVVPTPPPVTPRPVTSRPVTNPPITSPPAVPSVSPPVDGGNGDDGADSRNPTGSSRGDFCGIRNVNGIDFQVTSDNNIEAEFGEFPWMVAVMLKQAAGNTDQVAICGGSLISPNVVLTGAHCVENQQTRAIKVRAGEWDSQTTKERFPFQERDVSQIIVHEAYAANALYNDAALLILERAFSKADNVGTVCLPPHGQSFGQVNCIATGWGKDIFGQQGRYSAIMKKIELPLVQNQPCERAMRTTRLGARFKLHRSFICAGGEAGKDTCTGDGGSPLVCQDPSNPNRYMQVGIVSWGIGCGEDGIPGVYADVTQIRSWVDQKLGDLEISSIAYTT